MSKGNRLSKRHEAEREKTKEAKSSAEAKKFMKRESFIYLFLKLLMLASFLYSGLFYGGITVVGVYIGAMSVTEEGALTMASANVMLVGILFMVLGLVLAFFKKYILSFIPILVGTYLYIYVAYNRVIKFAADRVTESGEIDLNNKYKIWYYPIGILVLISFVLAVITVIKFINRNRITKKERDNAPVKSIVD